MIYFIDTSAWIKFFIIHADLFINSDDDLRDAAKDCGLTVWNPVDGKFGKVL